MPDPDDTSIPFLIDADTPREGRRLADAERLRSVAERPAAGHYFAYGEHGLTLVSSSRGRSLALRPDFTSGPTAWRLARAAPRTEALARACGLRGGRGLSVVDATAGLGRDAMMLASLGARVTLVERSRVVVLLLADALRRAALSDRLRPALERMEVVHGDAVEVLRRMDAAARPDAVYLDPMFAAGTRRARAGKEMEVLQSLLGPAPDETGLLDAARRTARARVVVKRHRKAAPLAAVSPHHTIPGTSTRFDVYEPLTSTEA